MGLPAEILFACEAVPYLNIPHLLKLLPCDASLEVCNVCRAGPRRPCKLDKVVMSRKRTKAHPNPGPRPAK